MLDRSRFFALIALLALPNAVVAEIVEITWSGDRFERSLRVEPGRFVELCGRLSAQVQVQWRFEAAAATDFNIHFHEGKVVHYPARKEAVTSASGTLKVQRDDDYCWMWTNKTTTATRLDVALTKTP